MSLPDHTLRQRLGLLTPTELALVIEVSVNTLREWRRLNQGPAYVKAGKNIMYRESDVREWIKCSVVLTAKEVTDHVGN